MLSFRFHRWTWPDFLAVGRDRLECQSRRNRLALALFMAVSLSQIEGDAARVEAVAVADPSLDQAGCGNGDSEQPEVSANGRFVAFTSAAGNLVVNGDTSYEQVYLRDRRFHSTVLVSVTINGTPGEDGNSRVTGLSADGGFAVFESTASDLVVNQTTGLGDIYLRDVAHGATTLISATPGGNGGNDTSTGARVTADGRYVVFQSLATDLIDEAHRCPGENRDWPLIYVRDVCHRTNSLVSADSKNVVANGPCESPTISSDGRFVTFVSSATNLTAEGNPRRETMLFRKDRGSGDITLISRMPVAEPAAMSAGGRRIAFASNNQIYVWDETSGRSSLVTTNLSGQISNGASASPAISGDGSLLVFISTSCGLTGDRTPGTFQIYGHNIASGVNRLLSVSPSAPAGSSSDCLSPSLSADGELVAFEAFDSELIPGDRNRASDIFAKRVSGGWLELISVMKPGPAPATAPLNSTLAESGVSEDGRYVLFWAASDNLAANDRNGAFDVFLRDTVLRTNILVSANDAGTGSGDRSSDAPVMSPDGRYVAFWSNARDLVAGHADTQGDLYVRDVIGGTTRLASVFPFASPVISTRGTASSPILIGPDGRYVAFVVTSSGKPDIALRDLVAKTTILVSSNVIRQSVRPLAITTDGALWYLTDTQTAPAGMNLFRYDIEKRTDQPVAGCTARAAVTADGRFAVGQVLEGTDARVWRYDTHRPERGLVRLASLPGGTARSRWHVAPSGDARFVAFVAPSRTDAAISDVFVVDALNPGTLSLVSINQHGTGGGDDCSDTPSISANSRYVAFRSDASDLVPGDNNGQADIFVRDLKLGRTTLVSSTASNEAANNRSFYAKINADGSAIAFESAASNLVPGDYNSFPHVFVCRLSEPLPAQASSWP